MVTRASEGGRELELAGAGWSFGEEGKCIKLTSPLLVADKRYGVSERRETYPIAAFSIDERMRCVEGGRDDVAAKSQLGVGSSNLGQGLAASQGGRAGAGAGAVAVGSHFDGRFM